MKTKLKTYTVHWSGYLKTSEKVQARNEDEAINKSFDALLDANMKHGFYINHFDFDDVEEGSIFE